MPVVVRAQKDDSTNDVIREFKKASARSGTVERARENQVFKKPSQKRAIKKTEKRRLKKRMRSLKKMKNVSASSIQHIEERLSA